MLQSTVFDTPPHGDVAQVQPIAQSLEHYEANARFDVPKAAVDHMDAMCAVAKCTHRPLAGLLEAHVAKRKARKKPTARYRFGAALEAYALYAQSTVGRSGGAAAMRHNAPFVRSCLLRAERNILVGYALDPHHLHANQYFRAQDKAAYWTMSSLASRMTLASLHQPRLAPMVFAPAEQTRPLTPADSHAACHITLATPEGGTVAKPAGRDAALAKRMLPPPPRHACSNKARRTQASLAPTGPVIDVAPPPPPAANDDDFFAFLGGIIMPEPSDLGPEPPLQPGMTAARAGNIKP